MQTPRAFHWPDSAMVNCGIGSDSNGQGAQYSERPLAASQALTRLFSPWIGVSFAVAQPGLRKWVAFTWRSCQLSKLDVTSLRTTIDLGALSQVECNSTIDLHQWKGPNDGFRQFARMELVYQCVKRHTMKL